MAAAQHKNKLQLVSDTLTGSDILPPGTSMMKTSLSLAAIATIMNTLLAVASISYTSMEKKNKNIEKQLHSLKYIIECITRNDGLELNVILLEQN